MSNVGESSLASLSSSLYREGEVVETSKTSQAGQVILGRPIYGETFAIHNAKRMGKTLTATFIITERLLENRNAIEGVVSNVHLNLENIDCEDLFIPLTNIEQLKELKGKYILFIDELRRYADSRMSPSQKNRFVSNLVADLGKQKVDFLYSDQNAMAVDNRIRGTIDYVLAPVIDPWSGWCKVYVFDSLESYQGFFHPFIPGEPYTRPIYIYAFFGPTYYNMFDTEQKIEDYHGKFNVQYYTKLFLKWRKANYPKKDPDYSMIHVWNKTEGIGLGPDECRTIANYIKLEGP